SAPNIPARCCASITGCPSRPAPSRRPGTRSGVSHLDTFPLVQGDEIGPAADVAGGPVVFLSEALVSNAASSFEPLSRRRAVSRDTGRCRAHKPHGEG